MHESKRMPWYGYILYFLFSGVWSFLIIELIFNPKLLQIEIKYILLNMLVGACVFEILFWMFNSLKASVIVGTLFYFIWGVAGYYTESFRGLPLQLTDILDAATAMEVAGSYEYEITCEMITIFALAVCLFCICILADEYKMMKNRYRWITHGIGLGAAVLFVWFLGWSETAGSWGVTVDGNRPIVSFYKYGTQLAFIENGRRIIIDEPEGYTTERVSEIVEAYAVRTMAETSRPNIIAIMNETFADVSDFALFSVSEEVMPFYESMQENAVKGRLMVSTYGGGTGKSEYEFLTGNSMSMYSSALSPYVVLGNRLESSMAGTLKEQGYTTYAMHPYIASNYNREKTYATMGFDEFFVEEDFENPELIRGWVSDRSCYQKIIELLENQETENPVFTFCVTIQNHSPYTVEDYESDIELQEYDCPEAEQYLSLIHESDQALKELVEYLENYDEPTVLVFFGDHLPGLPTDFYEYINGKTDDELDFQTYQKYYMTPYVIWANYDIQEEENKIMSANYLGSYVLDIAGVEMTQYNQYLLGLQEEVPAFSSYAYCGKDGLLHAYGEDEAYEELFREQNMVQYNQLFDKAGRIDSYYSLSDE